MIELPIWLLFLLIASGIALRDVLVWVWEPNRKEAMTQVEADLMAAVDSIYSLHTEVERLREAIASALTSLGSEPGEGDGYAYQVLDAAPHPNQETDDD